VDDGSNDKREQSGPKGIPQYEIDAEAVREKTARLRDLRLAQGAAGKTGAATTGKRTATKKKTGKSAEKAVPLSDWLNNEQEGGHRN
jgi:hypothetical protein